MISATKNLGKTIWAMAVILTAFASPLYAADTPFAQYSLDETQGKVAKDNIGSLDGTVNGNAQWGMAHSLLMVVLM